MNRNYTNYDAIDFAEDPSFIRWVQGKDTKAKAFWEEWEHNYPEKSATLKEAKTLVNAIQFVEEEPSDLQIKNLWDKIDTGIQDTAIHTQATEPKKAIVRSINRRQWIGYVAAASIALLAFFYFYNPTTTLDIGNGTHIAHTLPDNSKIELNAASTISYKKGNFLKERIVELEGEAFFEVEEGGSFKVITAEGLIEVLGTSFNVNTRDGGLAVDCRDGIVRVSAKGSVQTLTAGEGTQLNPTKTALEHKTNIDISKAIAWRDNLHFFDNVPFDKVIEALERQFDIEIQCDQELRERLGNYQFEGKDLAKAVEEASYPLNVEQPIIKGKMVIIKAKQ